MERKEEKIMKWDKTVSSILAVTGSCVNYLWGGLDVALKSVLLFMFFDYILGVLCGFKDKNLSSQIAFKGIARKVAILVIIAVSVLVDELVGTNGLMRSLVIFFYVGLEGISILENASKLGAPVPERLKDALIQLKDGNKKEIKDGE